MPLLCCDCNRKTKSKLEDENQKKNFFYVCLASLYDKKSHTCEESGAFWHLLMNLKNK